MFDPKGVNIFWAQSNISLSLKIPKVQSESVYIEEEQTAQWSKEKVQKDKQRSTKHTYKTKDRVTRTPSKTGGELRCSGRVSSSCSTSGIAAKAVGTIWIIICLCANLKRVGEDLGFQILTGGGYRLPVGTGICYSSSELATKVYRTPFLRVRPQGPEYLNTFLW